MQAGEGRGLLELLGGRQLDQHAGRPAPLRWQAQVVRQVHGVVERLGTPTNRPIRCADLTLNSVYTCLGASHGTRLGRFIRGEVNLSADVKGGQNATLRLCRGALVFTSLIKELPQPSAPWLPRPSTPVFVFLCPVSFVLPTSCKSWLPWPSTPVYLSRPRRRRACVVCRACRAWWPCRASRTVPA